MVDIDPTADVATDAQLGSGTKVWHLAQVRERAVIGEDCVIGRGAYIGIGVRMGARVKVQNLALVYDPAVIGEGAFIGPGAILTNDRQPRAINPDGSLKRADDWATVETVVGMGASIGAGAILISGVNVGDWALVGAAAVVTRDVPPHALVVGNPARRVGWVDTDGSRLTGEIHPDGTGRWRNPNLGTCYRQVDERTLLRES